MEQTKNGNFIGYINQRKRPGDKNPMFKGRISQPGTEQQFPLSLWAHEYPDPKTGEMKTMFNGIAGRFSLSAEAAEQITSLMRHAPDEEAALGNLTLSARQVVLFPNRFKEEAPEKDRPDYWGGFNPGDGSPIVRVSAWMSKDRYQNAILRGGTSYPIPGKSEAEMQTFDRREQDQLSDQQSLGSPGGIQMDR